MNTPTKPQSWFEMRDISKRQLITTVWIPLCAVQYVSRTGKSAFVGYSEEYLGVSSLAVPVARQQYVMALDWDDIGSGPSHVPETADGRYTPADVHEDYESELLGTRLVMTQHLTNAENDEWHLHQDLVIALQLKREGDIWVCPREAYQPVARLLRDDANEPVLLEIKADFLRDYLCARACGLYVASYRSREEIVVSAAALTWASNPIEEEEDGKRWMGQIQDRHEGGGFPFGADIAVMQIGRSEVDLEEDVPSYVRPADDEVTIGSWTSKAQGQKILRISGELWRTEWLAPAAASPRVRRDKVPTANFFVTDAAGTRENKSTLAHGSRWLWFRPQVVVDLLQRRGSVLVWYSRETGGVGASIHGKVHFGVNKLGLLNVYAEDIAKMPDWEQQIWSGYSVGPDGGVSSELMTVQMRTIVAETQAAEGGFGLGLKQLNELFETIYHAPLFRYHSIYDELVVKTHRFRAIDEAGLYELAKDVARLTADSIDAAALQQHAHPPKGEKWGSLKSLEKLLALKVEPATARKLLTPLAGTYDLRLADAHLPSSKTQEALALVGIDPSLPYVWQGHQLLEACAKAIFQIITVLNEPSDAVSETPEGSK